MQWSNGFKISGAIATSSGICYFLKKHFNCVRASEFDNANNDNAGLNGQSELKLKHIQVYFRHGARTPIHVIPSLGEVSYSENDILGDVTKTLFDIKVVDLDAGGEPEVSPIQRSYEKRRLKGGGLPGSLTCYGQEQMFDLGRSMRQDYASFLPREFDPDDIYVRSTNIHRTIASLRCVLAGLYGSEELNAKGPVTIPVSRTQSEILFPNSHNCPVVRQINHASMIHFDDIPGFKEDRKKLENILGIDSEHGSRKLNFIFIRDDIVARVTHGYPMPDIIKPFLDMIEKNAIKMMYYAFCGQSEAQRKVGLRLTTGLAVGANLDRMEEAVQGKRKHKMCLYSTHDSTLVALLASFDIFDHTWPPFAADLRLELYEDSNGKHWVKVLYCGKEQITRGNTKVLVPYEEFKENMKPMTIEKKEYDEICKSKILEEIANALLVHEKDEVEDEEDKEDSDKPAGM
ncbi:hypothetical protein SNE40_013292 [Patella caerulea]|uniref:Acid phosphatase n=1 Tax=Patella caerulea TaxID=87958 RepID=A0AAN8PKZ0_PATCE